MKKHIKQIIIAFILIIQFGCSNWMDILPPNGLTTDEFWKTKEDVESVLMAAYSGFASQDGRLFFYGEARADMVKYYYNLDYNIQRIMNGDITSTNYICEWTELYKVINYCNLVIKNAPQVQTIDRTFDLNQMKALRSEAYFLRSLAYFYLVRVYKDVPLVLVPSETDASDFYIPKSDEETILKQIKKDLLENKQFALEEYPTVAATKGRATRAAFSALLADVALWNFDYEECIGYVNEIQALGKYDLIPGIHWFEVFSPGKSLESIFEFQYDQNKGNSTANLTASYSPNYLPSDKAVQSLANLYVTEPNRGEDKTIMQMGLGSYYIWKYTGALDDGITQRNGTEYATCSWIVYRYADVMLMKAEALSQVGKYSEALQLLNEVRERAGVGATALANSATAYEDAILSERAVELAFEGKRWFDLMRMGRRNNYERKDAFVTTVVSMVSSSKKRILSVKLSNPLGWYLPIPEGELQKNKNLEQNPYYNY